MMNNDTRDVTPGPWRVGSKVRRTIYRGHGPDDLIGIMDRPEDAAYVVLARTEWPEAVRRLHEAEDVIERLRVEVGRLRAEVRRLGGEA